MKGRTALQVLHHGSGGLPELTASAALAENPLGTVSQMYAGKVTRLAQLHPCGAAELDKREPAGYVLCESTQGQRCRLEGLLLAVEAPLCKRHQSVFEDKWRVTVTRLWDSTVSGDWAVKEAQVTK